MFLDVFGAQLRKANDLLRVCEPLRILLCLLRKGDVFLLDLTGGCQAPAALLVFAALRCSFFFHLLSRVHYLFVVEL